MLRSFTLQPLSLVIGSVFALACFMAMGQTSVSSATNGAPVRVEYMPHPRDMVQIKEGAPYTVPPGRILVLTALGSSDASGGNALLKVDGQTELTVLYVYNQNPPSVAPIAQGFTAPAGSVIEPVDWSTHTGRAWGYLAPQ